MTALRVYPAKLAPRERKLLSDAYAVLADVASLDRAPSLAPSVQRAAAALLPALAHRLACAARHEEMRERRLTERERLNTRVMLRGAVLSCIATGDAEHARDGARALVRLLR